MKKFIDRYWMLIVLGIAMLAPSLVQAQTDPTDIVTATTTLFVAVATLCVAIGIFFIGYRIARKIR